MTPSCLTTAFRSSGTCEALQCLACLYAKTRCQSTQTKANVPHPQAGHLTPTDRKLLPGELISMDHLSLLFVVVYGTPEDENNQNTDLNYKMARSSSSGLVAHGVVSSLDFLPNIQAWLV